MVAVAYFFLLALAFVLCVPISARLGLTTESHDAPKRQLQTHIHVVGNDGVPSSAFPLGLCQGDCDHDSDCGPNLICYQRNGGDAVPGCDGGETDNNRADFCIPANGDDSSSSNTPPSQPSTTQSSDGPFRLKLYWQQGYYWQEETFERKWCLRCHDGQNSCSSGDTTLIVDCDADPTDWGFIAHGNGEIQIKYQGDNLCLERSNAHVYLRVCDSSEILQRWVTTRGSFDGDRFELTPSTDTSLCAHQDHHPKNRETIFLESCQIARYDTTSYWNKY